MILTTLPIKCRLVYNMEQAPYIHYDPSRAKRSFINHTHICHSRWHSDDTEATVKCSIDDNFHFKKFTAIFEEVYQWLTQAISFGIHEHNGNKWRSQTILQIHDTDTERQNLVLIQHTNKHLFNSTISSVFTSSFFSIMLTLSEKFSVFADDNEAENGFLLSLKTRHVQTISDSEGPNVVIWAIGKTYTS